MQCMQTFTESTFLPNSSANIEINVSARLRVLFMQGNAHWSHQLTTESDSSSFKWKKIYIITFNYPIYEGVGQFHVNGLHHTTLIMWRGRSQGQLFDEEGHPLPNRGFCYQGHMESGVLAMEFSFHFLLKQGYDPCCTTAHMGRCAHSRVHFPGK